MSLRITVMHYSANSDHNNSSTNTIIEAFPNVEIFRG